TYIYTLSLHDALPICPIGKLERARRIPFVDRPHQRAAVCTVLAVQHRQQGEGAGRIENLPRDAIVRLLMHQPGDHRAVAVLPLRSEEHTSELQSRENL